MKELIRATTIPLVSIFGSGFMVIVPITMTQSIPQRYLFLTITAVLAFITLFAVPAG
jgi:hypothetical protein